MECKATTFTDEDLAPSNLPIPKASSELLSSALSLVEKVDRFPEGCSEFQMRNFVVGSETTLYGQCRQAIAEIRSRYLTLESLYLQRERSLRELRRIEERQREGGDDDLDLDCLEKQIEIRERGRRISIVERELSILIGILSEFDPETGSEPEEKYWEEKFRREVNLNLALRQSLQANLLERILNMPESSEVRQWLLSILQGQDEPTDE